MSSLTILTLAIIAAANMAVGGCIGICGIAGFLLPMLYTGGLGFDVTYALALSFLAFLVSGIIGSFNYYKAGNLEVRMSLKLGIGSLIGAIACVQHRQQKTGNSTDSDASANCHICGCDDHESQDR